MVERSMSQSHFSVLVIIIITPSLWSQRRSLWMLFLPAGFVCARFRLWVLLWFFLVHCPLLLSFHYPPGPPLCWIVSCPFGFFFSTEAKNFTNRSPTGLPRSWLLMIVEFVIKTMNWSHQITKLESGFDKCKCKFRRRHVRLNLLEEWRSIPFFPSFFGEQLLWKLPSFTSRSPITSVQFLVTKFVSFFNWHNMSRYTLRKSGRSSGGKLDRELVGDLKVDL